MTLPGGLALNAALASGYWLLAQVGLALALPPGYVSAIWPASGLAIAAAWRWGGKRTLLGVFAGSLVVNAGVSAAGVTPVALAIAAGSTAQAWLAGSWLRARFPQQTLDEARAIWRFSSMLLLVCLVAASVGNAALLGHGVIGWRQLPQSFLTWWLGDAFGALIFVPLTMMLVSADVRWRRARWQVGLPLAIAFLLTGLVYGYLRHSVVEDLRREFAGAAGRLEQRLGTLESNHARALRHLALGYQARGATPGAEFEALAGGVLAEMPGFRAIEWAPEAARRAAEARVAPRYPDGFAPAADGLTLVVERIAPLAGNEEAQGLDLYGEPKRAAAARAALRADTQRATRALRLAQDPAGPGAVLLFTPLRTAAGAGVLVGVLDLRLIEAWLRESGIADWRLDERVDGGLEPVWGSLPDAASRFDGAIHIDREGVFARHRFRLADRHWELTSFAPHAALRQGGPGPLLVMMMAFAACAVLAVALLQLASERERIHTEVLAKTAELSEKERFLANVIENSGALIFVKDAEGRYLMVNRRWEATTGLARDRVLGRLDTELFPDGVGAAFRDNDVKVMRGGELQELEEVLGEGEQRRWFLSIKFPLRDAGEAVVGICGMTTEITDRKRVEEAMRAARDAAEAADRAKSRFLATMSHELRTPLNGIIGMAQMLVMAGPTAEERETYAKVILDSGKSLLAILNDVLDFSKIEAGRMELAQAPFDPVALLDQVALLFREAAAAKGLRVEVASQLAADTFLGDAARLRQMLSNLVNNAIKFSSRGVITLELARVEAAAGAGGLLEFAVSDQGIGIAEADRALLFQPFVQVDGSATRRFGGTGLGLSIVRRLAEQMGGSAGVDSEPGHGSRFWFRVRLPGA